MSIFTQTQTTTGIPWGPLQEPTLEGVDYVSDLLEEGPYQGDYTTGIDPTQQYGVDQGISAADATRGFGESLAPDLQTASDFWNRYLDPEDSQDPWSVDPDNYLAIAGLAADNPYLDDQIQSALRDPYRMFSEGVVPGLKNVSNLYGQPIGGGGSSDVMMAHALRSHLDRQTDTSAGMRGNAWNTGLQIADRAASRDANFRGQYADNLFRSGETGVGYMNASAADLRNIGDYSWGLDENQRQADEREFYEPWRLAEAYGNYTTPLSTGLKETTVDADRFGEWLLSGPVGDQLGKLGGTVLENIWDSDLNPFKGG